MVLNNWSIAYTVQAIPGFFSPLLANTFWPIYKFVTKISIIFRYLTNFYFLVKMSIFGPNSPVVEHYVLQLSTSIIDLNFRVQLALYADLLFQLYILTYIFGIRAFVWPWKSRKNFDRKKSILAARTVAYMLSLFHKKSGLSHDPEFSNPRAQYSN